MVFLVTIIRAVNEDFLLGLVIYLLSKEMFVFLKIPFEYTKIS